MDYKTIKRQWAKRREKVRQLIAGGMKPGQVAKRLRLHPSKVSRIIKGES